MQSNIQQLQASANKTAGSLEHLANSTSASVSELKLTDSQLQSNLSKVNVTLFEQIGKIAELQAKVKNESEASVSTLHSKDAVIEKDIKVL